MSCVIVASVKVRNCNPEILAEAAKIVAKKYDVKTTATGLVVGDVYIYASKGELRAETDSDFVSRKKLNEVLGFVRDAIVAAEIVRAAKVMGRSVDVRVGERGIAVDIGY